MFERFFGMLIEKAHGVAMKWHLVIGFGWGSFVTFFQNHWENIVDGALAGLAGAIAASVWKAFADYWAERKRKRDKRCNSF